MSRAVAKVSFRVLAVFVFLPNPWTHAVGLRGVAIGDPCTAAFESELASGSWSPRLPSEIEANDYIVFRGTHDGKPADFGYRCSDAVLTGQLVVFMLDTETEARAVFEDQYKILRDLFGAPCTDFRKLSLWQYLNLWLNGMYFSDIPSVVQWDLGGGVEASLNTGTLGSGPDNWSVVVNVSWPGVFVLNQDGSRSWLDMPPMDCLHDERRFRLGFGLHPVALMMRG